MQAPRVDPVGIVEYPSGYRTRGHRVSRGTRLAAVAVLVSFVSVVAVTTALSAGGYCLTSDASSPSPLHPTRPASPAPAP